MDAASSQFQFTMVSAPSIQPNSMNNEWVGELVMMDNLLEAECGIQLVLMNTRL